MWDVENEHILIRSVVNSIIVTVMVIGLIEYLFDYFNRILISN